MMYDVYRCTKCGSFCAARAASKSYTCVSCGCRHKCARDRAIFKDVDSGKITHVIANLKIAEKGKKIAL
uniref:DUF1922 domain-containing protein n=1 Tax=Candidatus Methanomethylicus mesodigestus TaxID=1867258 RepID=A0A7C3NFA1_9CREN